ncbi:hypothetical protein BV22DRAFT_1080384 [Leucogyrophana mollusca]|uniref:Uncharacterized protein n=1 Tax=Leucogyrophana mollusca TaxID=85980 RepID=A0ACB8BYM3_9AGAM|nr:hypothetical protein BV22DRAFT_1080384 [Leucogyrophana mollusca]
MSSLPRKPDFGGHEPGVWPDSADTRRPVGRPAPMAPPDRYRDSYRRDERDSRERSDRPHYPHGPSHRAMDSYVAPPAYKDREGQRRDHHERMYQDSWPPPREQSWEPERRSRDREWESREERTWVPRAGYDADKARSSEPSRRGHDRARYDDERAHVRSGDYDRGRGPEYERERDYDRSKATHRQPPRHDNAVPPYRRGRSSSRSPPRSGSSSYPAERYKSNRPARRSPSPQSHLPRRNLSRSTADGMSRRSSPRGRAPLESHRSFAADSRSPARSPHYERRSERFDEEPVQRKRSRSRSPPRETGQHSRPHSRASYRDPRSELDSRSDRPVESNDHHLLTPLPPARSPPSQASLLNDVSSDPVQPPDELQTENSAPAVPEAVAEPVQSEVYTDKGKSKDAVVEHDAEGDVKMRSRSTSPPRLVRTPRSPPRHPRNYVKTPPLLTPSAPPHPSQQLNTNFPPKSDGPVQDTVPEKLPAAPKAPSLPQIPKRDPLPNYTASYEAEIARIEAHRAHITAEYAQVAKATRRALHELELATIELRVAQGRREIAETHRKKANLGMLGIDAETTA